MFVMLPVYLATARTGVKRNMRTKVVCNCTTVPPSAGSNSVRSSKFFGDSGIGRFEVRFRKTNSRFEKFESLRFRIFRFDPTTAKQLSNFFM